MKVKYEHIHLKLAIIKRKKIGRRKKQYLDATCHRPSMDSMLPAESQCKTNFWKN